MKGRVVLLLVIVFFGFSCRNSKSKTSEFVFPQSDSIPVSEVEKLSPEAIADISKNISSPVEIANLASDPPGSVFSKLPGGIN